MSWKPSIKIIIIFMFGICYLTCQSNTSWDYLIDSMSHGIPSVWMLRTQDHMVSLVCVRPGAKCMLRTNEPTLTGILKPS